MQKERDLLFLIDIDVYFLWENEKNIWAQMAFMVCYWNMRINTKGMRQSTTLLCLAPLATPHISSLLLVWLLKSIPCSIFPHSPQECSNNNNALRGLSTLNTRSFLSHWVQKQFACCWKHLTPSPTYIEEDPHPHKHILCGSQIPQRCLKHGPRLKKVDSGWPHLLSEQMQTLQ